MTNTMLWRRFLGVSAALIGVPIGTHLPTSAEEPQAAPLIDCSANGVRTGWTYSCTVSDKGEGEPTCSFSSAPTNDEWPGRDYFATTDKAAAIFSITTGDFQSFGFAYPEFKATVPWQRDDLTAALTVDGREIWRRTAGYVLSGNKAGQDGPTGDIVEAMRDGRVLRAALFSPTMEPLLALDYPLEGFGAALGLADEVRVTLKQQIADGAQCKPSGASRAILRAPLATRLASPTIASSFPCCAATATII